MRQDSDTRQGADSDCAAGHYHFFYFCILLDLAGFLPAADLHELIDEIYDSACAQYVFRPELLQQLWRFVCDVSGFTDSNRGVLYYLSAVSGGWNCHGWN